MLKDDIEKLQKVCNEKNVFFHYALLDNVYNKKGNFYMEITAPKMMVFYNEDHFELRTGAFSIKRVKEAIKDLTKILNKGIIDCNPINCKMDCWD